MRASLLCVCVVLLVTVPGAWTQKAPAVPAAPEIDGDAIVRHTEVLSSDEYEGRFPGTRGEDLTVAYIEDQFRKAGLKPCTDPRLCLAATNDGCLSFAIRYSSFVTASTCRFASSGSAGR